MLKLKNPSEYGIIVNQNQSYGYKIHPNVKKFIEPLLITLFEELGYCNSLTIIKMAKIKDSNCINNIDKIIHYLQEYASAEIGSLIISLSDNYFILKDQ